MATAIWKLAASAEQHGRVPFLSPRQDLNNMLRMMRAAAAALLSYCLMVALAAAQLAPANTVYAGPRSGSAGQPTFRPVVGADLPGKAVYITDPAFGAVADSTTDNAAAIQAAIDSLPASGGTVVIPRATTAGKCYAIASTIKLGNGTNTSQSTVQNIRLVGDGIGSSASVTNVLPDGPSCLKWAGASGGTMVAIEGPILNTGIWGVGLDANSLASTLVRVTHASGGQFNFSGRRWTGTAVVMNARTAMPTGVAYGNCGNYFHNLQVTQYAATTASGILLDGDVTSGADSCSNVFMGGTVHFGGDAGTYGVKYRFADNNTFIRTVVTSFDGTSGRSFEFERAASPKAQFPLENTHYSIAANRACGGTAGTVGGNIFYGQPVGDGFSCTSVSGVSTYQTDNNVYPDAGATPTIHGGTNVLNLESGSTSGAWLNLKGGSTVLGSLYRSGNDLAIQSWTGGGNILLNPSSGNVQVGSGGLVVSANAGGAPVPASGTTAQIVGATGNVARLALDGIAANASVTVRRANGTIGSPTALLADQLIFGIAGQGYTGSGYSASLAGFNIWAGENFDATHNGMYMTFATSSNGSTTNANRMFIRDGVSIGDGGTDPGAGAIQVKPQTFASLKSCSSTIQGAMASVTDSATATWGATITGGSTNHVLAYCNGTNWTVMGK